MNREGGSKRAFVQMETVCVARANLTQGGWTGMDCPRLGTGTLTLVPPGLPSAVHLPRLHQQPLLPPCWHQRKAPAGVWWCGMGGERGQCIYSSGSLPAGQGVEMTTSAAAGHIPCQAASPLLGLRVSPGPSVTLPPVPSLLRSIGGSCPLLLDWEYFTPAV